VKQSSVVGLQTPLPQVWQTPQSGAQLRQSSPVSQKPLPQAVQLPQSVGQLLQVSVESH
jgi:hypothetical protein